MELKGKQLSLGAKLAAIIFALLCFALMAFFPVHFTANDVIKIALFIALVFSPVDISLWIENFSLLLYSRMNGRSANRREHRQEEPEDAEPQQQNTVQQNPAYLPRKTSAAAEKEEDA